MRKSSERTTASRSSKARSSDGARTGRRDDDTGRAPKARVRTGPTHLSSIDALTGLEVATEEPPASSYESGNGLLPMTWRAQCPQCHRPCVALPVVTIVGGKARSWNRFHNLQRGTEGVEALVPPGARRKNTGSIRPMSNAAERDASPFGRLRASRACRGTAAECRCRL